MNQKVTKENYQIKQAIFTIIFHKHLMDLQILMGGKVNKVLRVQRQISKTFSTISLKIKI
jgi:hypothetical protein